MTFRSIQNQMILKQNKKDNTNLSSVLKKWWQLNHHWGLLMILFPHLNQVVYLVNFGWKPLVVQLEVEGPKLFGKKTRNKYFFAINVSALSNSIFNTISNCYHFWFVNAKAFLKEFLFCNFCSHFFCKGSFTNYVDQVFGFFDHIPTSAPADIFSK